MLRGMLVFGTLFVITKSGANCEVLKFYRIGREYFVEDDCPEDEMEAELAPIAVQLAYVRQVTEFSTVI